MFQHLKISTRFVLVILGILFSCLMAILLGSYIISETKKEMDNLFHGGVEDIFYLNKAMFTYRHKILTSIYKINPQKNNFYYQEIREGNTKGKEAWDQYIANSRKWIDIHSVDLQSLFNRTQQQINDISVSIERFQDNFKENNEETRREFFNELAMQTENLLKQLHALVDWHAEDSINDYNTALKTLAYVESVSFTIFIITSLAIIALVIWIAISILRPLKRAVEVLNKLACGNLNFTIEDTSTNEIGQLLNSMKSLGNSSRNVANTLTCVSNGDTTIEFQPRSDQDTLGLALVNMLKNLRAFAVALTSVSNGDLTIDYQPLSERDTPGIALANMLKNLRLIIGEIQDQVTNLTTSSQEIAATISQVATSSSETAAAVTETTTSAEELKQTAHVTDEKAKDVLNSSEETLQTVSSSEKFLQNTMDDMRQINDKMRAISDGIVKLSEHSRTIGDIIDTVNDLAEQSNLLAVNAAIEAAKAGEHGKSFAVVAQEIRTLAEQSKAATFQVRSILNEIQNATSSAVLATEQGTKAVEKGVKQSAETNESMQVLSQNVTKVTQYANQIALSSQQQFIGIDQVTIAMNNISGATGLLVDHMREIETAISSLNTVGENLKDMTHKYILSNHNIPTSASKKGGKI